MLNGTPLDFEFTVARQCFLSVPDDILKIWR